MTIRPHPDPAAPDATWRDVPVVGFTVAAGIAVLFCLVWLRRDGLTTDYTWGLLLAPVLMGVAGVAVMVLWERRLARVPRLAATLVAGGALLAFVLALAWWLVEVNAPTHLFTGSTFWLLAVAPVCAGLAWLAHRLLPAARRPVEEPPAALDDDAWARRLAGVLRLRKDLPDARVGEIVRDARARGAAAGRPLAEELGSRSRTPRASRRTGSPRPAGGPGRVTAFVVIILATRLPGVVAGERLSAWDVAYLLLAVVVLVSEWRDYRAAVRREDPETGGR
ncbi:hypothetical protein [Micrococcus luteus]|uniref:hypothetical protein n=1 Tax=Micrococcus luteus TaxID=1270 RepID=UPI0010ADE053|nr:hypothetical protein [Micrococcus luteus]TKD66341.1 hypothetical protein FCL52_08680 [Micrococcus luteus]